MKERAWTRHTGTARVLEQILAGQSCVLELGLDSAFLGSLETAAAPAEAAPGEGGDQPHS